MQLLLWVWLHLWWTSIFTRLTPRELEEFCRSHADLSL